MSCNNSTTIDDYLSSSNGYVYGINSASDECWPWTHLSPDDIRWANEKFDNSFKLKALSVIAVIAITPVGLVSSLLTIVSVWNKAVKKKEKEEDVLDLLYTVLSIPNVIGYGYAFPNVYRYSYSWTWAADILYGIVYGISLCSDLTTLTLTIDRFRALHNPCNESPSINICSIRRLIEMCLVILLSITRAVRYDLEYTVVESEVENGTYDYAATSVRESAAFAGLVLFSDMILPFLLLILMTYYSIRIVIIVIRKHRNRVRMMTRNAPSSSTRQAFTQSPSIATGKSGQHQAAKDDSRTSATLRLLLILVVLFTLNQLGYALYTISFLVNRMISVYWFEMRRIDLERAIIGAQFGAIADFVINTFDILSRSINFYLYFWLSSVIRGECKRVFKRA